MLDAERGLPGAAAPPVTASDPRAAVTTALCSPSGQLYLAIIQEEVCETQFLAYPGTQCKTTPCSVVYGMGVHSILALGKVIQSPFEEM